MSLLQNSNAIPTGVTAYNLTDSLRFRQSVSAYLSRTHSSAPTNAKKGSLSVWLKRGSLATGNSQYIMETGVGTSNNAHFQLFFDTSNNLNAGQYSQTPFTNTSVYFRDPSAWYHIFIAYDSTQATAADRFKLYVNNTLYSSTTTISLNNEWAILQASQLINIGRHTTVARHFDGYMTEFNVVDGQALAPTDFGEYDDTTGVWKPKEYTGTYGTNGFYLDMSTSGSTVTDQSGNGNNWTATNMNLTTSTATTYDKMTDVPTLTDEDTGNFATLNPLDSYSAGLSEANLKFANGSGVAYQSWSSIVNPDITTYKFYCEVKVDAGYGIGIAPDTKSGTNTTTRTGVLAYYSNGNKFNDTSSSAYGATFTTNDIIGIAMGNGQVEFFKNGVSQGVAFSSLTGAWKFGVWAVGATGIGCSFNFGQRPFAYTPPTGYKKLNTYNLPDSAVKDGSQYFNTVLDTGANIKTTSEAEYTNQLEWIKDRANANNHQLIDSVRGLSAVLQSNSTGAETTYSAPSGNSVGWVWRASDSTAATISTGSIDGTNPTIASTVSANTTSGFSVVTHTATGTTGTVGHGLGITPKIVIEKTRSTVEGWLVQTSIIDGTHDYLLLHATNGKADMPWGSLPTNQVFSSYGHTAGTTKVAYCFAEVEGFSKFGSYTGNGSADGPFVYTGFRPAFLIMKRYDSSSAGFWVMHDSKRDDYNPADRELFPNDSSAEYEVSTREIDLLSNGFKFRDLEYCNYSSAQYIYMAFAESPFKNSLGR